MCWKRHSCLLLAVQNPYQEGEKLLYSFASQEDLKLWTVFSDQEYGGKSTAELALSGSEPVSLLLPGSGHACYLEAGIRALTSSHASPWRHLAKPYVHFWSAMKLSAGACDFPGQHLFPAGGQRGSFKAHAA